MKQKAFTALEVMLVIALIAISTGIAVLFSQTSQLRADINAQASNIVSSLRLASSNAASGKGNNSFGIHFEADSYTLFEGSTFSVSDVNNFTHSLPSSVLIQNISLNGGGAEVLFEPPFGETNQYGSIEVYSSRINKVLTISITQFGTIGF